MTLLLALAGCPSAPAPDPAACADVTWASHGAPLVDRWCLDCHHGALAGDARNGAPPGLDLDEPSAVAHHAPAVVLRATGVAPTMPPEGGPTAGERAGFALWAACGAPLPTDTRCAGETLDGDLVVSQAPPNLCPSTRWIAGDVRIDADPATVSCLCGVGGDLRLGPLAPDHVALPGLIAVQGTVDVSGSPVRTLDLPALARAGRVRVQDAPVLAGLSLAALRTVDGSIVVRGNQDLEGLDLRALHALGGVMDLRGNPSLRWFLAPTGLETLPDGLDLTDTPELTTLEGFSALQSVGGPLELRRSGLRRIDALEAVQAVGPVSLVDLEHLTELRALQEARVVSGTVWLSDVGPLEHVDLLGRAHTIEGSVIVDRMPGLAAMGLADVTAIHGGLALTGNPALTDLSTLRHVARLDALSVDGNASLASLEGLHGVVTVEGTVRIESNASLGDLEGLRGLQDVLGDLVILDNPALTDVTGLQALAHVGGDVRIEGNPVDPAVTTSFLGGVAIDGSVVITP